MDDSAPGQDGESTDASPSPRTAPVSVVDIAPGGEVILDARFENSPDTIKTARKAYQAAIKKPGAPRIPEPNLAPEVKVAFRVELAVLRKHSKYFDKLLGNTQFDEARLVQDYVDRLKAQNLKPEHEGAGSLPWIAITDDDEATRSVGREKIFEDMLRILHDKPVQTGASAINMAYVAILAVLADRFDCQRVVARYLSHSLKFKWPLTSNKPLRPVENAKPSLATEQVLRQKILVAWLLEQPLRLHNATREIIMRGSSRWSPLLEPDETPRTETWWDLPDGLEHELQYRREAILDTIASVQRHFLNLYSSRDRQCKLGYDSSSACDSFQLGQMLKFFTGKGLLALVDFGPSSLDALSDPATAPAMAQVDLDDLLTSLRQCPSYQVDSNHYNCGLRTRLEPIVDFIHAMLSSNIVSIPHKEWKLKREVCSWAMAAEERDANAPRGGREESKFAFTRGLAVDQRMRVEGTLYADKMARKLFNADTWDWTPEY